MPPLILASASPSRAALLQGAGFFAFEIIPSGVDETKLKAQGEQQSEQTPEALSLALASAKAAKISRLHPEALVIGSDQILALPQPNAAPKNDWQRFDKPETLAEAKAMLKHLRGQTHYLHNGSVLMQKGETLWQHQSHARMKMRGFSDDFLATYLAAEGEQLLSSAGAYRLEGAGVHLFEEIAGDYFTILGLPLVPLLAALRQKGAVLA